MRCVVLAVILSLLAPAFIAAQVQRPDLAPLLAELDEHGVALHADSGVSVHTNNYEHAGAQLEALAVMPPGNALHPGLLLIPGHGMTARGWIPIALEFAKAGYVCLVVTQPGYGGSDGPADFVGPRTVAALAAGFDLLRELPETDPARLGIVGYSRGAMAAALLATQLPDVEAAVLAGGVYDFRRAYDETALPGIRANMEAEAGLSEEAVAARSAVQHLDSLHAAVLILHGGQDVNAPVSQAQLLAEALELRGADYELRIFPEAEHSIGLANFRDSALEFLSRKL